VQPRPRTRSLEPQRSSPEQQQPRAEEQPSAAGAAAEESPGAAGAAAEPPKSPEPDAAQRSSRKKRSRTESPQEPSTVWCDCGSADPKVVCFVLSFTPAQPTLAR